MGILLDILTFPISGPINTVLWLAETIGDRADDEIYSPEKIRAQMTELELRFDMGELDEETFYAAEEELLARLRVSRQRLAERAG
jgi:Gas vesicle protein G